MHKLVENEILKVIHKKRIVVIIITVAILVSLFAYGEYYRSQRVNERIAERLGTEYAEDWRLFTEQQLLDHERRLENPYLTEERSRRLSLEIEQYQYYLENDINPSVTGSATFTRMFMEQSILLFLPLLVMILVSDLVSGEFSGKTIKLLLTRPVSRWKILTAKMLEMIILVTLLMAIIFFISALLSTLVFGQGGWGAPVTTGFTIIEGRLGYDQVTSVPQWLYITMIYALAWYVAVIVGFLTMMLSVLSRNTGITIGLMMAALIAGSILSFFINDWPAIKYFFVVHLNLISYLSGNIQPAGLTLGFSLMILAAWGSVALFISYMAFIRQDVLA